MRRVGNLLRRENRGGGWGRDYRPLPPEPGMFGQFDVLGSDIVAASANYNNATLGWMFGVGQYGQIRLTDHHKVQLVSPDQGSVSDRTRGGGRNLTYRVAICWYLGVESAVTRVAMDTVARSRLHQWSSPMLYTVLSSDFDMWWTKYVEDRRKSFK